MKPTPGGAGPDSSGRQLRGGPTESIERAPEVMFDELRHLAWRRGEREEMTPTGPPESDLPSAAHLRSGNHNDPGAGECVLTKRVANDFLGFGENRGVVEVFDHDMDCRIGWVNDPHACRF